MNSKVNLIFNKIISRHDISKVMREEFADMVKDHTELIYTGIVERECFEALVTNSRTSQSKYGAEDIWHFLIAFNLATEIKRPMSLYIPSLIPDHMEDRLNARLAEAKRDKLTLGFHYCFEKCDKVFGLFNKLLVELASSKYFYKEEQPGVDFQAGFSVKIENRKLGDVAAMEGSLRWHEDDQSQTDIVEFFVVERDCNFHDLDKRFGRHKVKVMYSGHTNHVTY